MKYIPADKLIAEIERRVRIKENLAKHPEMSDMKESLYDIIGAYKSLKSFIFSLQQEQSEVQNGKFVFPKYLYARTKDNKTIDMSYAPQDMTAIEYIRNDFVEQEQPEVDLEKEIDKMWNNGLSDELAGPHNNFDVCARLARNFFNLGLNARKEESK